MRSEVLLSVIQDFYAHALADVLIGYQFKKVPDFQEHIPRILRFWCMQLGVSPPEGGEALGPLGHEAAFQLIKVHLPLHIHKGEVGRWGMLFREALARHELPQEFAKAWLEKIAFFEKSFVESPLLFQRK